MPKSQCQFVWYDFVTSDSTAAKQFYSSVVGWNIADARMPNRSYSILSMGALMVGGLTEIAKEANVSGVSSSWMGYIDVDNVDQYINEVVRIGGTVQRAAEDIPGVGRYAIVADPNGAAFTLFTSLTGQTPDRVRPEQYGRVAWHELETPDINGSFSFYSSLFGWKKERAARPSERDGYQLFAEDGTLLGRLTETSSRKRGAFWRYAFNVQNIGAAIERVKGKGGHATEDPVPNVGDSLLARCMDPQGAEFAVIQLTK